MIQGNTYTTDLLPSHTHVPLPSDADLLQSAVQSILEDHARTFFTIPEETGGTMPNPRAFQVGDRVRCVRDISGGDSHRVLNLTGTVYRQHLLNVDVIFDDFTRGHGGLEDDGSSSHWCVRSGELELLSEVSRGLDIEPESQEPGGIMPNTIVFQVGDRVRCVRGVGNNSIVLNLTGTVYRHPPLGVDVIFDHFDAGHDGEANDGSHNHMYVRADALELLSPRSSYNLPNPIEPESQEPGSTMPNPRIFQVGDRVRCVADKDDSHVVLHMIGTVSAVGPSEIDVVFDNFTGGHGGITDDETRRHWYVAREALEYLAAEPEPEPEQEPAVYCSTCGYEGDDCQCRLCEHCDQNYYYEFCPNGCSLIRDYTTKVERLYPAIPPFSPDTNGLLRLGVELEVEAKGDTVDGAEAVLARREAKNWIICKSDGSLNDGFEVVTVPSILEEHTRRWPVLLQTLRRHTTSWNNKTTGLHVHLSRSFFTQLEIAKFVVFMNSEATRPYVISLAGRSSPEYAALKKKELGNIDVDHSDRYEAVNLQNHKTIEVRIFKGTLNTQHVLADIEFCDALARWVKINTVEQCENWHDFMAYVTEQGDYPNLFSYMTEREEKVQEMLLKQFARHTEEVSVDLTDEGGE